MLNRNDDQNEAKRMVLFCVAAASMVLLLFLVTLYMHESKNNKKHVVKEEVEADTSEKEEVSVGESNIVSEDLDFWDMYDEDEYMDQEDDEEEDEEGSNRKTNTLTNNRKNTSSSSNKPLKKDDDEEDDDASDASMNSRNNNNKEDMDDGKHIKVVGSDGKDQWFEILEDVKKNNYKFNENLSFDNGLLKYKSSDIRSYNGIDISSYQGTIDFSKVKNAGIDFVMIKVASRGYESGQITIDDKFVDYAGGAITAGIPIGLYVGSQAITDIEAVEEANFAVAAAANYNVRYPIAMELGTVSNDKSRTDKLTNAERTAIVKKFCETVASYGKTPAISASRDFLISKLNLNDLTDYDIWLKDEAVIADYMKVEHLEDNNDDNDDMESDSSSSSSSKTTSSSSSKKNTKSGSSSSSKSTSSSNSVEREDYSDFVGTDYPYEFKLWRYSDKGTINGIEGTVNMDISFVNYVER